MDPPTLSMKTRTVYKQRSQSKRKSKRATRAPTNSEHHSNYHSEDCSEPPALGFGPQPKPELQSPDDSSTNVKEQGCPICGETIKNASDWARHWRTIHTNVGMWVGCPFCGKFDRVSSNIINHELGHIAKDKMRCTERLPSGLLCTKTFDSPEMWDRHRAEVHHRQPHPYLYTKTVRTDGVERRHLEATHTEAEFASLYPEFLRGCPEKLKKLLLAATEKPPIAGARLVLSPVGVPYLFRDIEWDELLDHTLRADMFKVQQGLGHHFCLLELEAIDRRFRPSTTTAASTSTIPSTSSIPSISSISSAWTTSFNSTSVPASTSTSTSTSTSVSSLTSSSASVSSYTYLSSYTYPPVPPIATPVPDTSSSYHRGYYSTRPQEEYKTFHYPTSLRNPPFPSPPREKPQLPPLRRQNERRHEYTGRRHEPYATAYHSRRSPTPPPSGLTGTFSSEHVSYSYMRTYPHGYQEPFRGSSSLSPLPSLSYSSTPSSSSSAVSSRSLSFQHQAGEYDHAPEASDHRDPQRHYSGYTSKTVSELSPYFRTILSAEEEDDDDDEDDD